jgi:phosphate transport system permease protein
MRDSAQPNLPPPNLPQLPTVHLDLTSHHGENPWLNHGFTVLVWGFSFLASAVLFIITFIVIQDAWPAIQAFGVGFIWSNEWSVPNLSFGARPFVYGTLVTSLLALVVAIPLGLSVAIVTSEDFFPKRIGLTIAFLVELLASIPSVIIGLWGIFVFIPVTLPLQEWLFNQWGWIPLFSTQPFGFSLFSAGFVLAFMILPTIAAISREVLLAIPNSLRTASMALGATRWETLWKLMLPAGSSGIIGAIILALGRALGETMAVTMVIGTAIQAPISLLAPGYSIPSLLATQFSEALEPLHVGALMYLALILFVITLVVNLTALLLVQLIQNRGFKQV